MELADSGVSNIHSLLWESVPVYESSGHKAKFVNVGAGMDRDVMICVHVSSCPRASVKESRAKIVRFDFVVFEQVSLR